MFLLNLIIDFIWEFTNQFKCTQKGPFLENVLTLDPSDLEKCSIASLAQQ